RKASVSFLAPTRRLFLGLVGGPAPRVAVNRTGRGPVRPWLARPCGRGGGGTLRFALCLFAFSLPGDDRRPLFITRRHCGGEYHGPTPSADAHLSGKVGKQ